MYIQRRGYFTNIDLVWPSLIQLDLLLHVIIGWYLAGMNCNTLTWIYQQRAQITLLRYPAMSEGGGLAEV